MRDFACQLMAAAAIGCGKVVEIGFPTNLLDPAVAYVRPDAACGEGQGSEQDAGDREEHGQEQDVPETPVETIDTGKHG
jgi:hypothetical protein